jgi:AcrR family transcriptional regulator
VRRALIIAAAQDCICEQGFGATSARVVAARAGVALGTVTYHFDSIDALLVAALRDASVRLTGEIVAAVYKETGAVARLHRLIDSALPSSPAAKRNWRLWLEYWARATHVPELAALHKERYDEWRGLVKDLLVQGVESGELVVPAPARTAMKLVALQDGLGLQAAIGDRSVKVATARELLYEFVADLTVQDAAALPPPSPIRKARSAKRKSPS